MDDKTRRWRLAIAVMMVLLQFRCKDTGLPVEPPFKDPLTMTWTSDTISLSNTTYQTLMTAIWARSARDVYIAGSTSEQVAMLHSDGLNWHPVTLPNRSDPYATIKLSAITGNSSGEIWVAGALSYFSPHPGANFVDTTLVLHYDGSSWRDLQLVWPGTILSLYVSSQQDIWVCGRQNTLFHFDGSAWSKDSVPISVGPEVEVIFSSITGCGQDRTYLVGLTSFPDISLNTAYFFIRKGGIWSLADSEQTYGLPSLQKFGPYLWIDCAGSLYTAGQGIYRWSGTSWSEIHSSIDNLTSLFGIDERHLFGVGINGEVTYFNGNSWSDFSAFRSQGIWYTDGWEDNSNVFIVGLTADGLKSIVLHGR